MDLELSPEWLRKIFEFFLLQIRFLRLFLKFFKLLKDPSNPFTLMLCSNGDGIEVLLEFSGGENLLNCSQIVREFSTDGASCRAILVFYHLQEVITHFAKHLHTMVLNLPSCDTSGNQTLRPFF